MHDVDVSFRTGTGRIAYDESVTAAEQRREALAVRSDVLDGTPSLGCGHGEVGVRPIQARLDLDAVVWNQAAILDSAIPASTTTGVSSRSPHWSSQWRPGWESRWGVCWIWGV